MADPRYEFRNPKIEELLRDIGRTIKREMPPGWGFGLFVFEFDGPQFFWLSSAQRGDMIRALEEFIQKERAKS